jgi:hypothetical protein
MKRFCFLLAGLIAAVTLTATDAGAGKKDDTLVWATDRDNPIADPYYINTRELVVIGHHVWDTLVFIDPKTGEIKPLLATKWTWVDSTTLELRTAQRRQIPLGQGDGRRRRGSHAEPRLNRDNAIANYALLSWIKNARRSMAARCTSTSSRPSRPHSPIWPASASSCRRATTTMRR